MLPEEIRRELGLGEFVCIELEGGKLLITKANGELARARAISRNLFEVCDMIDGLGGVTAARQVVDLQDRVRLSAQALKTEVDEDE